MERYQEGPALGVDKRQIPRVLARIPGAWAT